MKSLTSLLTSLILAGWISTIAIVAIQNFTPVSLRFIGFQSFEIPVGLVLAFSVGLGLVGTAIIQPLLGLPNNDFTDDR